MKTMKKNNEVVRVTEEEVDDYLDKGYKFCPKSKWKQKQLRSAKNSPVQDCMAYNTTIDLDINGVKTVEEVFNDKLYVSNKILTDKGYMPFLVK